MIHPIYDAHRKAFTNVSAWVILDAQGVRVATVAIKYGALVTAYTHFDGLPMTRGSAGGGGYDRESSAVQNGFGKCKVEGVEPHDLGTMSALGHFRQALNSHDGSHWFQNLERAGYQVLQAV